MSKKTGKHDYKILHNVHAAKAKGMNKIQIYYDIHITFSM